MRASILSKACLAFSLLLLGETLSLAVLNRILTTSVRDYLHELRGLFDWMHGAFVLDFSPLDGESPNVIYVVITIAPALNLSL